jgi:hypothetical protein
MLLLFYTVYRQLSTQPDWEDALHKILYAAIGQSKWKLYCMIALMGINWSIEAAKWQIALRPVQKISFGRALKAILAGTCIASFTPNRVGEYIGRLLFVEKNNKIASIAPSILCSMSQMLVTLTGGTIGLFFISPLSYRFGQHWISATFFYIVIAISLTGALILALVYFRFEPFVKRLNYWLIKRQKKVRIPENFKEDALVSILLLSVARYGVFITQYFLLFSLFGMMMTGGEVFTGVSVMFVLMAIVPTLTFLTDLGFRWVAGIQIFKIYTLNTAGIIAVSFGVWFINLIIPALIGSLLILSIKLFSSDEID